MEREEQIWIKLAQMPNYLSKRLTPQRDEIKLVRAPERGSWSVKEIVEHLRDTELRGYAQMHLIATEDYPDLTEVSEIDSSRYNYRADDSTLMVMSQFRRLRMTTISLLRELPDDAWERIGQDRYGNSVPINDIAMELVMHDAEHLAQLDATLIERDAMPHNVTPIVA